MMNYVKRFLMVAGVVALAVLVGSLAAPKTVQATVAAFIRDVDNPGRATIVNATCGQAVSEGGLFECSPIYTVPTGYRLVVEQVEGSCITRAGQGVSAANLQVIQAGFDTYHAIPLLGGVPITLQSIIYSANLPVRYYADPGSGFTFTASASDQDQHDSSCTFALNGYLISYP